MKMLVFIQSKFAKFEFINHKALFTTRGFENFTTFAIRTVKFIKSNEIDQIKKLYLRFKTVQSLLFYILSWFKNIYNVLKTIIEHSSYIMDMCYR